MNEQGKKALITVAEWLEAGAQHVTTKAGHNLGLFDMEQAVSGQDCGTACCVAGAVVQFENLISPVLEGDSVTFFTEENEDGEADQLGVGELAQKYLGITYNQSEQLFTPWDHFEFDEYTEFSDPARAAKVIRHFIKTGVINWDIFPPADGWCY